MGTLTNKSSPNNDMSDDDSLPPPTDSGFARAPLPPKVRGARYLFAGLLVTVIVTIVTMTYLRVEKQLKETLEAHLEAGLRENVHSITSWLDSHQAVTTRSAKLADLVALVQDYTAGTLSPEASSAESALAAARLRASLGTLLDTGVIRSAAIYGPDGRFWFDINPEPLLKQHAPFPLRTSTRLVRAGAVLEVESVSPLLGSEKPLAYLSILSDSKTDPLFPRAFLNGKTYAFDRDGVLGKGPGQNQGVPPAALAAAAGINNQKKGVVEFINAEKVPVLLAFQWIERHQVGVATEIPKKEALGSIARLRRSFLVLVILVGAAVLAFMALGRWTLRVREESRLMTRRLGRLARAIQPLSAALEHDPSAVVLVDADGSVVYANASSHRVLKVNSPLLGRDVEEVFDNLDAELQTALISGRDSIVAQGTAGDDETLLVSSRNLTIDGNPHYLYLLRPVTQQVRRQEVEHWKKLIRVLSHELNNALAPIISLLSSARMVNQMSHQDPRLFEIFESIAERTSHLVSFIEGYREVARLPSPAPREVLWEEFLAGLESQKKFRRIGKVPRRLGHFDPIQLERVLVNVLNNAYEAGSAPEDVTVEVLEEAGGFRVNVMDRGSGMPEPVLKQAMLPFFSTKRTGTGVGLALSREIIEAHGGQLTLANRAGGGLLVSCLLPPPTPAAPHPSRSKMPISASSAQDADDSDVPDAPT